MWYENYNHFEKLVKILHFNLANFQTINWMHEVIYRTVCFCGSKISKSQTILVSELIFIS